MATTLEQFKRAFSGQVTDDLLKQHDQQAESALKQLKDAVHSLDKTAPTLERHRSALVDLVKRYAETKQRNGRPQDELGRELQQIHQETLAQVAQVQGISQTAGAPPPTASGSLSLEGQDDLNESRLDDGPPLVFTPYGGEETLYRNNLQGLQKQLDQALNAIAPDGASREKQNHLRPILLLMTGAEAARDFTQASSYADELPSALREYEQAVDAYNKRNKADRDAQAAFEKRYDEIKLEIDTIRYWLAPFPGSAEIQLEIDSEEQLLNATVLQANFVQANQHLDKIAAAIARFKDVLAKHNQAITEKDRKEAPKRAFEASFNPIKASLEAVTKRPIDPKEPLADQRKKLIDLHKQLKTQLSAKEPDYKAAGAQVDLIRRTLFPYQANLAALKKQKDDAAEADARERYPIELAVVDNTLSFLESPINTGGAPFDKKASAILDKLKEKRKYFSQAEKFMPFVSRLMLVREMKRLAEDYIAASAEFWKSRLDHARAMLPAKDVKAALDPKGSTDDLMKDEQGKLKRHLKDMDRLAGSKDFYNATLAGFAAVRQLRKFKLLSYTAPGPDGKEIVIKAKLLGPAIQGPASHTLLMLLDKQGKPTGDSTGAGLNTEGATLLKSWTSVYAQEGVWRKKMDFIHKDVAQADATLKKIAQAGKAIENGAGGKELATAIIAYRDQAFAAKEVLTTVNRAWKAYEKALLKQTGATLNAAERSAKRDKTAKEAERDAEAENVKASKANIKAGFGKVVSFLADPSWKDVTATIMSIGTEMIGDALADALVSTKRLNELQALATQAAAELEGIEDQKDLNEIAIARIDVEDAMLACEGVKATFQRAGLALDAAEKNVAMAMKRGGMPEAGEAVEKRRKIAESAKATMPIVDRYVKEAETLKAQIEALRVRYLNFGAANAGALDLHMESVHSTALGNAESLREFGVYLLEPIRTAKVEAAYLGGEDYLKKYDKVGSELVKAVLDRKK